MGDLFIKDTQREHEDEFDGEEIKKDIFEEGE